MWGGSPPWYASSVVGPAEKRARLITLTEWAALPEDELGEVVDGWLVEEEAPDWVHEETVGWLIEVLRPWVRAQGGRIGGSGARLAVAERRGRCPDVVIFLHEKPSPRGLITALPDIVIEIVSASPADQRRDRVTKLAEYAAQGIPQYWIIDPALRSLEILVLNQAGRYEHAVATTDARLEEVPGCPGLMIDLPALWAELDELEPTEGPSGEGERPS